MVDQIFSEISRESVRAAKGTVLMRQGEVGRSAYFVVEGRLIVEKEVNGENYVIGEIGPRDIVGEMAILDDSPRSATVTVAEDALLVMLDKNRIKQIIRRSPVVAELILKLLCFKLRTTHRILSHFNDIDNPSVWLKIGSLLQLCQKAVGPGESLLSLFQDQLHRVVEIPSHRLREVMERLCKAQIISQDYKGIQLIGDERLKVFLTHAQEEYANEDIEVPTKAKIFQAVHFILEIFGRDSTTQEFGTIHNDHLLQALVSSTLWKHLRPAMQTQRANAMIENLILLRHLDWVHQEKGILKVFYKSLRNFPPPSDEIMTFEAVRTALINRT